MSEKHSRQQRCFIFRLIIEFIKNDEANSLESFSDRIIKWLELDIKNSSIRLNKLVGVVNKPFISSMRKSYIGNSKYCFTIHKITVSPLIANWFVGCSNLRMVPEQEILSSNWCSCKPADTHKEEKKNSKR
ncbi:hypothetical protein Prudu_004728 [Prunus dulcis]|uniref:Uncharacterized protein n=1 Tax=Prunus dulcis TaxID=3755 RepID=A0A4Y1QW16_PRUDU|nr:hypothetical protein Prudu_004728 [Prunus dulcis]